MFGHLFKNSFNFYLKRVSVMERYSKILATSRNIQTSLKKLTAELNDLEKIYEEKLSSRLEKENKNLTLEIQKCKEELTRLENRDGVQVPFKPSKPVESPQQSLVSKPEPPKEDSKIENSKGQKQKKEPKIKAENKEKKPADNKAVLGADELPVDVGRLDIRVGKIVEIKKHPDADSLYVEQVDIGKGNPITVVSGLVKHVPIEEMEGRLVVLLCNLKPAKMRGITSEGMVMCASTPEKVEVLSPPPSAIPGDLVEVEGFPRNPDTVLNPKKKIFETVAPDLKTNNDRVATYKGNKWLIPGKGEVITQSLVNVNIK